MSNCTYCKTKHARGNNYSYPVQEIKKKMEEAVQEGATEIWLTSQDTGCYGLDSNTNLPQLLEELLTIRGDYRIRLGMLNPTYALVFLKKLIVVMQHPKMFKFLHIPVQSGNNRVLKAMARGYKVDAFVKMVNAFREAIPKITISTDIIVGFPTETEEEFQDTLQLIKDIKPEVCNISRFWLRPGTKAEEMEQVHGQVSKVRSQELTKVFHKIVLENNASWKDWEGEVLIQEVSAPNNTIARNDWYKQIILREELNPGTRHLVTIVKTTRYDLRGELRE